MITYTLTFREEEEVAEVGFTQEQLGHIKTYFNNKGYATSLICLNDTISELEAEDAYFLIVKNGVSEFTDPNSLYEEQESLEYDTKAWMYGRVVNKHARYDICFADYSQDPDYEDKKCTIVDYNSLDCLSTLHGSICDLFEGNFHIEGNKYFDINTCGTSYHGESERKKVIGVRIGETLPIVFRWYKEGEPISEQLRYDLDNGDIYVMSEKATGNDWKTRKIPTLRHAEGCDKYINPKPKSKRSKKSSIETPTTIDEIETRYLGTERGTSYTIPQLKSICKLLNIVGYSKLKKEEILDRIRNNLD